MTDPRLLLVDDEPQLVRVLRPSLEVAGYTVDTVTTGEEAVKTVMSAPPYDVIILDLGLPDIDGKEVIERVRRVANVPIVVLSARDAEQEKIDALDLGANDFVNKPFAMGELMARLRAAMRQGRAPARNVETVGHLEINFADRRVRVRGREVRLSPRELKLLRAFVERRGEVLTHKQIVAVVWGADQEIEAQFVRVLVANLRQKIELDPADPQLIVTEAGVGYRLREPQ